MDEQIEESESYKASVVILGVNDCCRAHIPQVFYKVGKNRQAKGGKDIENEVNAALVSHLLARRGEGSPHRTQLEFECGLRKYNSQVSVRHETKFDATPSFVKHDPLSSVSYNIIV